MLIKIGLREDAAAAGLVDDGRIDIEPPPVLQDFLGAEMVAWLSASEKMASPGPTPTMISTFLAGFQGTCAAAAPAAASASIRNVQDWRTPQRLSALFRKHSVFMLF